MAKYYWEADGGDVGGLPTNATVNSLWHVWESLQVAASSEHPDFPYALRASVSNTNARRIAAFSDIGGNSLTQSGVTEVYAVYAISRTYIEAGFGGRIWGNASAETGVLYRNTGGIDESQLIEYNEGSYAELATPNFTSPSVVGLRMQFDGSTVKLRIWDYDTPEPGTWNATVTTGVTSDGMWGLHNYENSYSDYVDLLAFGFGNDGDAAPTEPVTGGGVTVEPGVSVTIADAPDPAIATGAVISPSAAQTNVTALDPAIAAGATINATEAATAVTAHDPAVNAIQPVDIEPTVARTEVAALDPQIATGALIQPDTGQTAVEAYAPTVKAGASVSPTVAQTDVAAVAPAIATGATIKPTVAQTAADAPNPTINTIVETTITPTIARTESAAPDPQIAAGVAIAPSVAVTESNAPDPHIATGAVVRPAVALTEMDALTPLAMTGVSIRPAAAETTFTAYDPVIDLGVTITPTVAITATAAPDPTITADTLEYAEIAKLVGIYQTRVQLWGRHIKAAKLNGKQIKRIKL